MRLPKRFLFALSGAIPLLSIPGMGPNPLLTYTAFVAVWFLHRQAGESARPIGHMRAGWIVLLCGLLLEVLAWATNYVTQTPTPALFNPQRRANP